MIDFHCHIDLYPNPTEVARACIDKEIYVLSVTTTPTAWAHTDSLSGGHMRTALGLHPQIAHQRKGELRLFEELLRKTRYVGEVGLDGSPELRPYWRDQMTVFKQILHFCGEAGGRIMSIHSRRAAKDVLDCLEAHPDAGVPILHWFSGSLTDLQRAVRLGCWFSVGPAMLQGAKGKALLSRMPEERILPESDGPFAKVGGTVLWPWNVESIYQTLATSWDTNPLYVENRLFQNLTNLVEGHS